MTALKPTQSQDPTDETGENDGDLKRTLVSEEPIFNQNKVPQEETHKQNIRNDDEDSNEMDNIEILPSSVSMIIFFSEMNLIYIYLKYVSHCLF